MKKIILIIFFCILGFIGLNYYEIEIKEYNIQDNTIEVVKGDNFEKTFKKLNLPYSIFDKIYFKLTNDGKNLKMGLHKLDTKMTKAQIVEELKLSSNIFIKVTIPEGFTNEKIFNRLESLGLSNVSELEKAQKLVDLEYIRDDYSLEGYLYPETYFFSPNDNALEILQTMVNEFLKRFPYDKYTDKQKFYNTLVLASIVELETPDVNEKEKVAGVFKHRLNIDMMLQSDATLKYEVEKVSRKDLKENTSLYNTYKHKGLTPSPICNPSENTILSTIKAKESTDLYFFMYKGKTYYSKTHEEHLRKRRKVGQL